MALEGARCGFNGTPPLPQVLYKQIRVPNAQVRTLFSTPFVLVPNQGPNRFIFPEYVGIHKPAGTAFTGGTNIITGWTGGNTFGSISVVGFLDQTIKKSLLSEKPIVISYLNTAMVGLDYVLSVSGSNPATSTDTDLFVYLTFRIWEDSPQVWM